MPSSSMTQVPSFLTTQALGVPSLLAAPTPLSIGFGVVRKRSYLAKAPALLDTGRPRATPSRAGLRHTAPSHTQTCACDALVASLATIPDTLPAATNVSSTLLTTRVAYIQCGLLIRARGC